MPRGKETTPRRRTYGTSGKQVGALSNLGGIAVLSRSLINLDLFPVAIGAVKEYGM